MYTEMQRVYFIYTCCFNLSLHSDIYVSPELCAIAFRSSAVTLSTGKEQTALLFTPHSMPLFDFYMEFFPMQELNTFSQMSSFLEE